MPGLSYSISVHSPCTGEQLVNKIDPNLYTGSGGDFNYAVLTKPPNDDAWLVTIYDYSGSSCTPTKTYIQTNPDADDPSGGYTVDGDPTKGTATVSDWP